MNDSFEEQVFREIEPLNKKNKIIKSGEAEIVGKTKISFEGDENEKVKVILKKDADDTIKELKFVCSCGETKAIILDYEQ
jgi:hypothetical protein